MCTSLALPAPNGAHLFGRTLDLDAHFGESVTLAPRQSLHLIMGGKDAPTS